MSRMGVRYAKQAMAHALPTDTEFPTRILTNIKLLEQIHAVRELHAE